MGVACTIHLLVIVSPKAKTYLQSFEKSYRRYWLSEFQNCPNLYLILTQLQGKWKMNILNSHQTCSYACTTGMSKSNKRVLTVFYAYLNSFRHFGQRVNSPYSFHTFSITSLWENLEIYRVFTRLSSSSFQIGHSVPKWLGCWSSSPYVTGTNSTLIALFHGSPELKSFGCAGLPAVSWDF